MKPSKISVRKRFHSITIIINFFFLSLLLLLLLPTTVASTKCPSISPPTIPYSQKQRDVLALPPRGAIDGVEITSSLLLLRGGGGASTSKDIIAKMKKPSKDAIILQQQQQQEEQSKLKTTSIRIGTETMVGILLMYLGRETISKPKKPNLPIVAGGACAMVLVLFELAYAMLGPQDAIRLSLATTAMASLLLLLQL